MKPALVWVEPVDCNPPHSLDLMSRHDADKVADLFAKFVRDGFDLHRPALVGYPKDNKIQLLSGTHRHYAANLAGIKLPVTMWLRSYVEAAWGTKHWDIIIKDIPVSSLIQMPPPGKDLWDDIAGNGIDTESMYDCRA